MLVGDRSWIAVLFSVPNTLAKTLASEQHGQRGPEAGDPAERGQQRAEADQAAELQAKPPARLASPRDEQRARDAAEPHHGRERPEPVRAHRPDLLRERRQELLERHREEHRQEAEQQQQERPIGSGRDRRIPPRGSTRAIGRARSARRAGRLDLEHAEQRRRVGRDPDRVRDAHVVAHDQQSAERGADHARRVHAGHVERDRTGEALAADQVRHDRLARGHHEREDAADHEARREQVPEREVVGHVQREHRRLAEQHEALRRHDQAPAIDAVGEDAADRRDEQHRRGDREAHAAERKLAAGQLEREEAAHQRLALHGEEERQVRHEEPAIGDRRETGPLAPNARSMPAPRIRG